MSQEWMSYPFTWRLPLSGDVVQNIYPTADFNYAGVLSIERDVVENVASFGTQLGVLSDAVLELAGTANGPKVQHCATSRRGLRRSRTSARRTSARRPLMPWSACARSM